MWIRELPDADAACGAKARGLAQLIAAGLRVPPGFVVTSDAFVAALGELATVELDAIGHDVAAATDRLAAWQPPAELAREVERRASALESLVVRSSAAIEDGARHAAPGVFRSVAVPSEQVWDAIRAVWIGAASQLAIAYARKSAIDDLAQIAMAVIVQQRIDGEPVRVYTRPLGDPSGDRATIERVGSTADHTDPNADHHIVVPRTADAPALVAALAAERAIAATAGADVELVLADAVWVVQARPIVHPLRPRRTPPPPIVLAALRADERRWTFDVTHNPDPLSPAQQGLVERVERANIALYHLALAGGYLYTTPRESISVVADDFSVELAAIVNRLEALGLDERVDLEVALDRYLAFYRIWARELSPLIAAGKRPLVDRVGVAAAAKLIGPFNVARDRVMAPAWDVAVPTFAERGDTVASTSRVLARSEERVDGDVALARAAAEAGELDDIWFARAQWQVRRALLDRGATAGIGDAIFWVPLDATGDALDLSRRAAAARAAHLRASAWDMPLIVDGARDAIVEPTTSLRGVGEGPRVVGRVVRFATLADARSVRRGEIVVTRAVTPALAMIVTDALAIVSETGGLLDHGAALARELGITCVVGCDGAWSQLVDGILVSVDGDRGVVSAI